MWKRPSFWWSMAIAWCITIALATHHPFFTGASAEQLLRSSLLNIIVRKGVHVTAFGLLASFFYLARRKKQNPYITAFILASLYGAVDEWHQTFIPGRDGVWSDVFLNATGALCTLWIVYLIGQRKCR